MVTLIRYNVRRCWCERLEHRWGACLQNVSRVQPTTNTSSAAAAAAAGVAGKGVSCHHRPPTIVDQAAAAAVLGGICMLCI